MDDIRRHFPFICLRVERHFIGVELVHSTEISFADAHDNDTQGQFASVHNLVYRSLHISDLSVGDDKQDVVLLILLSAVHIFGHLVYKLDDWRKVCRTTQCHVLDGFLVCRDDPVYTVDLRVEDVAI